MLIPTLRYRDCDAALRSLTEVVELTEIVVYRGEDGGIQHAELGLGSGAVMLGPTASGSAFDAVMTQPEATGGMVTTSIYAVVDDVDAAHDRVVAAGADVFLPLKDEGYGRMFSFRDPEGHVWSVGDYVPGTPMEN